MDWYSDSRVHHELVYTVNQQCNTFLSAIIRVWLLNTNADLASFNQCWVQKQFEFGDHSFDHKTQENSPVVYLKCQGKVRIVGFDPDWKRKFSIELLVARHFFRAGDRHWYDRSSNSSSNPQTLVAASTTNQFNPYDG